MELIQNYSLQDLNNPIITFVGRPIDSNKGITYLLDSIKILKESIEEFTLWVVGGALDEATTLKKLIEGDSILSSLKASGKIYLWGRVSNEVLPEIYSRSYLCIIPSLKEEFGMVAIESMLCGCPVIANKVGGLQDIVKSNKTGLLVNTCNPKELADAIQMLLADPSLRNLYSEQAFEWASKFDVDSAYDLYLDIYSNKVGSSVDFFEVNT